VNSQHELSHEPQLTYNSLSLCPADAASLVHRKRRERERVARGVKLASPASVPAGASTPHKLCSKCSMENLGGGD